MALLEIYLAELCQWNEKTNLTGLTSKKEIIEELLFDSILPSAFLPDQGRFLDVGSGGGFPGIPLKICKPEWAALFLEPNSKKASFLQQVIRLTKLRNAQVVRGRIEESARLLHPEGYHVITARALAHFRLVLKWCPPHLAPGGYLVTFQGSQFKDALENEADTIKASRLLLHKIIPYALPEKGSQRNILIFIKKGLKTRESETGGSE